MPQSFKRKNGAANAALSGFNQGFQGSINSGIAAQRTIDAREQDKFENDLALRKAKQVDDELKREEEQRSALADSADLMVPDAPRPQVQIGSGIVGANLSRLVGTGMQDAEQQDVVRVRAIARRMLETGVPADSVQRFTQRWADEKKKAVDEDYRARTRTQIANMVSDGAVLSRQLDGTKVENPKTMEALQKLTEMSGNPSVSAEQLIAQKNALKMAQVEDESRFAHIQTMDTSLGKDIATVESNFESVLMGPGSGPETYEAFSRQMETLHKLRTQFVKFYDEIQAKPGTSAAFMQAFDDAKNGIEARVKDGYGREIPVTFQEMPKIKALFADQIRQQQEMKAAQIRETEAHASYLEAGGAGAEQDVRNAISYVAKNPDMFDLPDEERNKKIEELVTFFRGLREGKAATTNTEAGKPTANLPTIGDVETRKTKLKDALAKFPGMPVKDIEAYLSGDDAVLEKWLASKDKKHPIPPLTEAQELSKGSREQERIDNLGQGPLGPSAKDIEELNARRASSIKKRNQ